LSDARTRVFQQPWDIDPGEWAADHALQLKRDTIGVRVAIWLGSGSVDRCLDEVRVRSSDILSVWQPMDCENPQLPSKAKRSRNSPARDDVIEAYREVYANRTPPNRLKIIFDDLARHMESKGRSASPKTMERALRAHELWPQPSKGTPKDT
jgi:hypothetical protein